MKVDPCKLEISLSKGEIRGIYLPPHSIVFGVKGYITLVEQVTGLGEAGFNLYIPIGHGDMYLITYGGYVLLEAKQYSKICAISPEWPVHRWARWMVKWCKSLQLGEHVKKVLHLVPS